MEFPKEITNRLILAMCLSFHAFDGRHIICVPFGISHTVQGAQVELSEPAPEL